MWKTKLVLKLALHVAPLIASGAIDAHTTNALRARGNVPGYTFREDNPLVRPFVGTVGLYPVIIGGDLAAYGALKYALHKPRVAEWFLRTEAAENFACAANNARQHVPANKVK